MNSLLCNFLLLAVVTACGCQRHEACDPADSTAVCTEVQKCFARSASAEACREAEQLAIELAKPSAEPADNGAAKALTY